MLKWLDKNFELIFLGTALILIVVIMSAQVFQRKILSSSLSWSEELCRYLFIWSGFLSISFTIQRGSAIRLDLIHMLVPKVVSKIINLAVYLFMAVVFGLLIGASVKVVSGMQQMATAMPFSMKWIYVSSTVGFILTIIRCVQKIVPILTGKNTDHPESMEEGGDA